VGSSHAHATALGAGPARPHISRKLAPLIVTLAVALMGTGGSPHLALADDISGWGPQQRARSLGPSLSLRGATTAPPKPLNVDDAAAETIALTNAFRAKRGLPAFEVDPVCSAAAFDHARDMAARGYFDHFGPGGSTPSSRYQHRNTEHQRVIRLSENIAWGNGTTPERALAMWLNSAGHRKHLVGTEMNHIGVGVANGACLLGPCTYYVQCFSRWP
jgi:uncharacterized protein YkwD